MGRKGRPRKSGERKPSGDLKKRPNEGIAPAIMGRIKAFAKFFSDPKFVSLLAMLEAAGELTAVQSATGARIGEIYRTYHRLKHLKEQPKSPSYEQGFGSSDLAEERMSTEQLEAFEAQIRKAEENWLAIDDQLGVIPRNLRQAVMDLCVYDTAINPMLYPDMRRFLDLAAEYFARRGRAPAGDKTPVNLRVLVARSPTMVPSVAAAPPRVRRPDTATHALEAVVRKLRPDLDADGVAQVREIFTAVRDREEFRRKKGGGPP